MKTAMGVWLGLALFGAAAVSAQVFDPFDEDPLLGGDWEIHDNLGALYGIEDGWWQVTCPAGLNFDHWVANDNAVQLRRDDFPEDFVIETRIDLVGTPDFFHVGLMVYFDVHDLFAWGAFCSGDAVLERTGHAQIFRHPTGLGTYDLQIRKEGSTYSFLWREEDGHPWHLGGTQTVDLAPQYVGLFIKNWNDPPVDTIVRFDHFAIEEGEAPGFEPIADIQRIPAGLPYAKVVRASGLPAPDLALLEGPAGLALEEDTLRGWTPEAADAGKSFPVRVRAENAAGSAEIAWRIEVTAEPFSDDFDGPDLDPAWTWHVPRPGPTWDLGAAPGWLELAIPNENYDHWGNADGTSFDFMPRLVAELPTDGDFAVETRLDVLPQGLRDHLHAGLWLGFDSPVADGFLYGPYGNSGVNAGTPYPLLRGERTGHWGYNPGALRSPVIEERPLSLRLEKRGDLYAFSYRYEDADPWTQLQEIALPSLVVRDVGLFIKNWDVQASLIADFDFLRVTLPEESPPELALPDCEEPEMAYAGIAYTRRVLFTEGVPSETDFALSDAPPGMIFDGEERVVRWTPSPADAGKTWTVALRASNAAGQASVSWDVRVAAAPAVRDEFDGAELEDAWEIFEPQAGAFAELADGRYRVTLPDGIPFDLWSNGNNTARQLRRSDMGDGDFSIQARVILSEETVADHDEFHIGLMVYFEPLDVFIWGFYGADPAGPVTELQVERTGIAHMAIAANESRDVRLRITKDCEDYDFYWKPGESDPWRLAASFSSAREVQYVGLITKTWSADVTADFEYFAILAGEGEAVGPRFRRGDINADGRYDISDAISCLNFLFAGGREPPCMNSADVDDSGALTIGDPITLLNYLFGGGPAPAPPVGVCGADPTPGDLGCASFPPCGWGP